MQERDPAIGTQHRAAAESAREGALLRRQLVQQGLAYHQQGRRDLAERRYREALAMEPDDADALHYLGVLRHQENRSSEAVALLAKAVSIRPSDAAACNNLGVALEALGRRDAAVGAYDRAVAIRPDYAEAWNNRGNALLALARPQEALASYDRALAARPGYPEALNGRGSALFQLLRYADSLDSCDRAVSANPAYAAAHNNRGCALLTLRQAGNALAAFDQALALSPRYAEALYNRGNALLELGREDEALASYDLALASNPSYPKALNNRGNLLKDQARLDEAVDSYRRSLKIAPADAAAHSNLLFVQHYMDGVSNMELLAEARVFGRTFEVRAPATFSNDRTPGRRLRIGYVSGDFNSHPAGFFVTPVLEAHDHERVEIYCYSNSAKYDSTTERFQRAAHHWRSIVGLSDEDAASLIARDRVDVLVDLSGHTAFNRLPMFARRPAPVQVSWQGYPGTTGLQAIDYLIMDEYAVLPDEEKWYTEAIVRLPYGRFCYSPPDYAPPPVDPPLTRGNLLTFGSFNNIAKIGPHVLELWAAVLRATPDSRLRFKWRSLGGAATRLRFTNAFAAAGVGADRLEFQRPSQHHSEHMAQYGEADIALDPFPFSGCTTTCEAFWMGVPVVTFPGGKAASRHVRGAFEYLGLSDCVANSPHDYVERAKALASDPARLTSLRRTLRARMAASPLCDGKRFAAALEWAFERMWRSWRCGQSPASFDVPRELYAQQPGLHGSAWAGPFEDRAVGA